MGKQKDGHAVSAEPQTPDSEPERIFKKRLGEVFEGLSDGVVLYDKDDRFVMCNEAYRQSIPEVSDLLVPGTHVEDVVRAIAERGVFEDIKGNPEAFVRSRIANFKSQRAPTEYKSTDGRWFLISDNKSPSGETMVFRTDITEIKRAQEALLESERRAHNAESEATSAQAMLLDAIDGIPAMMALFDKDNNFVLCNEPYRKTLHKIADKLVPGVSFYDLSYAGAERGMVDGYQDKPEEWARLRVERFNTPHEPVLHQQMDGKWVLTADHKTRDGSTLIVRTDVTAMKEAEETASKNEERLRRSQDYARIGTWDRDLKTNELFWSDNTGPMLGYAPGAIKPSLKVYHDCIHPEDRGRVQQAIDACLSENIGIDIEYRVVWPDDSVHWLHERGDVVRDENGDDYHILGVVWDITKRKVAEDELRKLSRAVQQSPHAVFITDTKGTIEYVNHKFTELTGYSEAEALGQNPRILNTGQTPKETYADLWTTIKAGQEWRGEVMDRAKDGSHFWVSETIAPVKNEAGETTHYVAMHEDITARKQADLDLRRAVHQADVANRAKTELLANMSHELRTPLNAIIGFSDAMSQQIFGPLGNEKYSEYIDHISQSGLHLLELINDILDVSAVEAGKIELNESTVNAEELVRACLELVRHRAIEGGIHVSSEVSPDVVSLYVDERRMKQILLNLMSNAVKFTPEGGRVKLTIATDSDGNCSLTVSDTGIGMNETDLAKAMTKFGQVDSGLARKHEGSGLGLPLTQGLVDLHSGEMTIESTPDEGTTVRVLLPETRVR